MIVNNAITFTKKVGSERPLNKFHDNQQTKFEDCYYSIFGKTMNIAEKLEDTIFLYKKTFPKKHKNHINSVLRILTFITLYDKKLLQVYKLKDKLTYKMLKQILENLESLELIKIYEWYKYSTGSGKYGYRPSAIKATDKLLSLQGE